MNSGNVTDFFGLSILLPTLVFPRVLSAARPLRLSQTASELRRFPASMNGFGCRPVPAAMASIVRPDAIDRSSARIAAPSRFDGKIVAVLDQQPVRTFAAVAVMLHSHQHPTAVQPFAFKIEFEIATGKSLLRRGPAFWLPVAPIPKLDRAAAVLALRNRAFKVAIVQRMILDLDRQPLVLRAKGRPFRHRPGPEHPVEFEAEVIVQACRVMPLDDKTQPPRRFGLAVSARFPGFFKVSLREIFRKFLIFGQTAPLTRVPEAANSRLRHLFHKTPLPAVSGVTCSLLTKP